MNVVILGEDVPLWYVTL